MAENKEKGEEGKILRLKGILLIVLLASMFAVIPPVVQGVNGPREDYLHIINYGTETAEFAALAAGEIDITDWPLDAYWTNQFAGDPDITMDPYSEIGCFEYDINTQEWPTGCEGLSAKEGYTGTYTKGPYTWNMFHTRQRPETSVGEEPPAYDPAKWASKGNGSDYDPETESWKVYFDENCLWCTMAWGMRLAIAYATNKDYITATILEGLGAKMITWAAAPAQEGYLDITNLTTSSFVYHGPEGNVTIPSLVMSQDLTKAAQLLDAAGFKDWDGNNKRNDPLKVAGPDKKYGTGDDVTTSASDLSDLAFYIRLDHDARRRAGLYLKDRLVTDLKVPIAYSVTEKTVCFKSVMVEYKYHIYTGGYSFGIDPPDLLYSTFHSSQYWAPVGWSGGYQGFSHETADSYLWDVKFSGDMTKIIEGVHNATYLLNKYVGSIPLWSSASAMAYDSDWDGVVNHAGYGITWGTGGVYYWSLLNMRNPATNTINLGFKTNAEDTNVVTSEWVWDYIVIDTMYEPLICRNPYNLAEKKGILATSWSTGTYAGGTKVYVDFTLKSGVKFHNGKTLTAEDVKWSREFMRDCGPGVAWNYPSLKNIENVTVLTPGEGGTVRFYMKTASAWALHDAAFTEILNPEIWQAADQALGWGYDEVTHTFVDVMKVRDYHPHVHDYYPGGTGDGIKDLAQDGTGPWVFLSAGPSPPLSQYIDLVAFRPGIPETPWQTNQHHMTQSEVEQYLNTAFHKVGNVNYPGSAHETDYNNAGMGVDRSIDVVPDILLIERASGTTPADPAGIDWDEWNVDADITGDNKVTGADYGLANFNLLATAG